QFAQIPAGHGLVFSIDPAAAIEESPPFVQGIDAGRRLLLAEPVSQPTQVLVSQQAPGQAQRVEMVAAPSYFVLDVGRVVHGRLAATVHGPPGTIIDIGWDERLLAGT